MWINVINWIKALFLATEIHFPGILPDTRTQTQIDQDYLHEETGLIVVTPNWQGKIPSAWKKFPQRFQLGSSSCVAQSGAKVLGVEQVQKGQDFLVLSALDEYDKRENKPAPGMDGNNGMSIIVKGLCLESQLPSQNMSEAQMNVPVVRTPAMLQAEQASSVSSYVKLSTIDIDTIASIVALGKAVQIFLSFTYAEWNVDVPVMGKVSPNINHAVAVVDYTMWQGQKALVIEDSWGNFVSWPGQRLITQAFLNARCYYAGYLISLKYAPDTIAKPVLTFLNDIHFGDSSNDVKNLQLALQYLGYFPVTQTITGLYGGITAKAVLAFQQKYLPASVLVGQTGQLVGPATRLQLSTLFSS